MRASLEPQAQACGDEVALQQARRQDDHVGVAAHGQLGEHHLGVEQRRRRVRRTDLLGPLELEGHRVDRDDRARAGDAGALNGPRADAAAPGHHDGLTGHDLAPVDRRAETRGDPAADERGRLHVVPRVDAHERVLVHHHLVGEGPQLRHAVQVLAGQVVAVGPVADHAAGQRHHPEVAEVLAAGGTPVARPTGGDEGHGDVVALGHLGHVGPDLGDDAGSLVAPDDREHRLHAHHLEHLGRLADGAVAQVLVGVAHARPDHLHPHLAVARRVDLDLFGLPGLVESRAHRRPRRRHWQSLPEVAAIQFASSVSPPARLGTTGPGGKVRVRARSRRVRRDGGPGAQLGAVGARGRDRHPQPGRRRGPAPGRRRGHLRQGVRPRAAPLGGGGDPGGIRRGPRQSDPHHGPGEPAGQRGRSPSGSASARTSSPWPPSAPRTGTRWPTAATAG